MVQEPSKDSKRNVVRYAKPVPKLKQKLEISTHEEDDSPSSKMWQVSLIRCSSRRASMSLLSHVSAMGLFWFYVFQVSHDFVRNVGLPVFSPCFELRILLLWS